MAVDDRSQARALALQALCLFEALGERFELELDSFLRDPLNYADLGWQRQPHVRTITMARELAAGAWRRREQADRLLTDNVPQWSVHRMQPVDRNILRLGLYELLEHPDRPHQVVIDEAIELAKHFGGADSGGFVNGVLDAVRKKLDALSSGSIEGS